MAKKKTINMVKSQVIYKDYSKDAERTALVSGENLSHMFGKIARWYTDISWVGHKHVVADITDFPTLGTAASKDVPASGDAGNDEVVMGNDSRLTDARTPTSHTHSVSEITDFPTLGTAAEYNVPSSGDASNNEVVLGNDSRLSDARTPLSHTHTEADITNLGTYAEGATKGGAATSANKLNIGNSDIGNSTTPVYFDSETGLPIALSYTIEKSVPADAVFTDTTYSTMGPSGSSHAGGLVPDTPSTAGTSKYLREDGTWAVPPNSEYVHPSYTPYSSGLYKITVDTLGHVSTASAVTGADLPSHSHTVSDITNFPTLGTAAGYDVPATGDADDDEVVLGNDSRLSDARTPLSHTHTEADISDLGTYAEGASKGGPAKSANKLNIGSSDIGSETKPVYFSASSGKPVACVYSLNASVPANAVFTDINVKQSPSTANESREVLFAGNTGNTETVGTTGKSNKLYFNPSTGALTATSFSGSVDASNLTGSIDVARLPNSGVTANSYGPAAGGTLTYGGTFDVPYVTVDKYGRLTAASTKTFTMPAQYTHPSYTSKTSGLYKITVDSLGHVSATAAVTASDLPSHSHTLNMASSTGSSSITLAANTKYQLTAGGSTYIFTTPTDTVYTHPTYTEKANGLYKITVDSLGHVSATAAVTASDLPSHTHPYLPDTTKYAGSSSVGGAATSANKLNIGSSNIGNSTTPVYFDSTTGLPVALNYTIEKSVPADAKFTDTVYTHPSYTAKASGLYKITVDELGHVSAASAVTGTDLPFHSHNLSIASSTGTSQISLSANTKYQLTAGGSTYIFTTPADNNTTYTVASGDSNGQIKVTPSSGSAYNVSVKGLGSAAYTNSSAYATSGHNHTLKIEASSGTSQISLSPNTKYQLTAGGSTYIFTTPPATTMTYSISTGDNNGQIKVTPSSGDAYNVSVKGLGSAAYTNSSAYAAASHTHTYLTDPGDSTYTIEVAWKGASVPASETSYPAVYTPYNKSAGVTYRIKEMSWADFRTSLGLGSAAYTNSSAYAAASHTHSSITGTQKHDAAVPTSTVGTGIFTMFYNVDNSTGNMPKVNNANAILQFSRHDGEYDSQLGFSSNGNIYYRYEAGSALTTSSPWKQLAWKDDRMGANSDGSYWGMTTPNNESDAWIRTTSYGIIPYQSGGAGSGHSSLGTSAWYFDSAFIDNIYGTLHGRSEYADNSYVLVTDPSSKGIYGLVFVSDPTITEDNTLRKSNSIRMNHFVGAADTEGITELILGNAVAKSSAGNSSGHLTLYNANGKWVEIYPNASATADYNLYLPASTGTLALVGDNNHTHNYAGSSSPGGAASSANKLNTNAGSNVSPVYFSGGVPVACKQVASGAYFSTVPYVRSDGVVEIGRYIDFHTTNTSTVVNYRIDQWTTESIEFNALGTNNRVNIYTPGSGYTRLSFQVGDVVTSGIIVKPLTSSGTLMQVECGGNMIIGSGESPSTLVSNSYDNIDTIENERLYLASDAEICFITSAQTYSERKEVILDTDGNFRIGPDQVIIQTQNSTSNYTELVNWWKGGSNPGNYGPSIGHHNTGDTDGAIILLPYHTSTTPWSCDVGLYISKTRLWYNGTAVSLNGHTHSYLPLSGGTMTGNITFTGVTSTSYPASSNQLYWSGSTDWAKIYYRVDASDAGRLVFDIGDDTNTRIDFAYNGTTKSYIDTNGKFSGTAAKADVWTTARTLTIGSTGKSVNGSRNVSWSLSEIGAAPASHSHSNYLGAKSANGFYGMASPSTDDTVWIRTTSLGLIPYQSGAAGSGHQSLGTSSWYFSAAYIDTVYGSLSGRASEASNCVCTYFSTDSYTTNTSYGMLFVADPTITEVNSLRKTDDIRVNYFLGAANTEGLVELVLGNATAKSSVNNASGHLTLYNANGKYAEIYPGSNSANINLTLPSSTGTLALVGDNNHTHSYIPLSGSTAITGELVTTSANGYRLVYNKYGAIIRNDGSNWWFLITSQQSSDAAAKTAGWANTNTLVNNSHPISIALSNGRVSINGYTLDKSVPSNAVFTDTNTTYTIATGDSNGQIKVTPSSGSAYNVSVKGLGSAAYTNSSAYAAASHDHGRIVKNSTISYGASQLQWFDLSGNGTVSASTAYNPSNDWYHHIMLNHANSGGYYIDLAICFHADAFYYKRIVNGSIANASRNNGWVRVLDQYNYGSYVTPNGIGAAPSGHTHSYAGSTTVGGDALTSLSLRLTHDNEVNCSKVSASYSNIWLFYRWSDGATEDATGSKYIDSIWFGNGNGAGNNTSVGKLANLVFNNINSGTLRHGGSSSSWWNDRNAAMIYQTDKTANYLPIWGCRTNSDGSWCCGNHNGDNLYFNFITKSVYDSGANPTYYRQIYFTSDAKIEARGYNIINDGSGRVLMDYSGIAMYNSRSGGWADGIDMYNSQNTLVSAIGFYGVDNALQYTYIGGSYAIPLLKIEPSTAVTTISGTEPYLYIVSSNHTNSGIVLQRGSSSDYYTDYRIINLAGDFKIQSDVESDVHGDWFNMMTIAYSTGDTSFKGSLQSGGDIIMPEGYSIKLRPTHSGYYAGIGYDTVGNECIAMWAKNTVTRLRWHAGIDMSSSTYNQMISLTNPDFEISKASGTPLGYIGGRQIVRSQLLFSGSTTITSGKEKTTITLTDTVSPFGFVAIRFYYSGNPAGYCETIVSSYNNNWMSGVFAVNPGGGAPGTYNACKTLGVYVNNSAQMTFNCDANLIIYNITGYCEG